MPAGVHCIDLMHMFCGYIKTISALSGTVEYGKCDMRTTDIAACFVFENGITGTILGTNAISFKFPLFELILSFESGPIHLRDLDGDMEILNYRTKYRKTLAIIDEYSRWNHYQSSFEKSISAYLKSIINQQPPPVPGIAGLLEF